MLYVVFNFCLALVLLGSNNVRGWGIRLVLWIWLIYTGIVLLGILLNQGSGFVNRLHF